MIHSVFIGTDAELVERLMVLHRASERVLDATFGRGRFWMGHHLVGSRGPREVIGLDRAMVGNLAISRFAGVGNLVAGDYTALPFRSESFDVVVCDPPFLFRAGDRSRMKELYGSFDSYPALLLSLERALPEFVRVLRNGGIVITKLMDVTEGRRRRWAHIDVTNLWSEQLRLDDLIIKIAPHSMDSPNWQHQERSRASHSYFMVFRPKRAALHRNGLGGQREVEEAMAPQMSLFSEPGAEEEAVASYKGDGPT